MVFDFQSSQIVLKVKMGKKRGKDKSSREEDDIDLSGKEFVIIIMAYDNLCKA